MDGSKYLPSAEVSHATRLALTVDRDAVGLMKHASQIGHLAEWWLQGAAASMNPLAALRLGRKLERFRLAARLAEGKSSRQVLSSLDTLKQEFALHEAPAEIVTELESARRESERLAAASKPPPTVFQEAFQPEAEVPLPVQASKRGGIWPFVVGLVMAGASGAAAFYFRPDLLAKLIALTARL